VGRVSKEAIDFLTRQIRRIDGLVEKRVALKKEYRYLLMLPGVGKILALMIMLETWPIFRCEQVGDYASYCRKVPSQWMSNGKRNRAGNKKNGNKYLAWAYSEATDYSGLFYTEPGLTTIGGCRR
jgi:transposase